MDRIVRNLLLTDSVRIGDNSVEGKRGWLSKFHHGGAGEAVLSIKNRKAPELDNIPADVYM